MTRIIGYALLLLALLPGAALAQVATAGNHLQFEEPGISQGLAQAAGYKAYIDGASAGTILTGVACTAVTGGSQCTTNIPALSVGPHSLTLTQTINTAESGKSSPLAFAFVIVVTPTNLQIVMRLDQFLGYAGFSPS